MTEIIIAIILQLATTLGGVPSNEEKANEKAKNDEKSKTENPINKSGGSGNWEDVG